MKKIFVLVIFSTFLTACVYDSVVCFGIKNRTNDTIYVCYARSNNIDSVKYGIDWNPFKIDTIGKLIINNERYENSLIFPDSSGRYCETESKNNFFRYNEAKKGYFFIIKLETVKNYTWEEIRKNKLYETMVITREMLNKNDWKIDYFGNSFKGIGKSVAIGAAVGVATTVGVSYAKDINPWNGRIVSQPNSNSSIQFGSNPNQEYHAFRHTDELGLNRIDVQNAIELNLQLQSNLIEVGTSFNRVIIVNGQSIQYTAYKLPNGVINVGRIHGVR